MKFNKQYKIGANKVELQLKPVAEIDSECNGGWAMWEQNKIMLGNDMPEDRQAVCFMHELLHMINIYLTEEQATYISEGLMQVIRDNKINFLS